MKTTYQVAYSKANEKWHVFKKEADRSFTVAMSNNKTDAVSKAEKNAKKDKPAELEIYDRETNLLRSKKYE